MNRKLVASVFLSVMVVMSACSQQTTRPDAAELAEIHGLLHRTFDRPGEHLALEPTVVRGDYAVVGWEQGEFGGRALVKRQPNREWKVWVCAGDHLKTAKGMSQSGVPDADATVMAAELAEAESKLAKDTLRKMSEFLQVMDMRETSGEHPPVH